MAAAPGAAISFVIITAGFRCPVIYDMIRGRGAAHNLEEILTIWAAAVPEAICGEKLIRPLLGYAGQVLGPCERRNANALANAIMRREHIRSQRSVIGVLARNSGGQKHDLQNIPKQ